jgi:hypothetical protein
MNCRRLLLLCLVLLPVPVRATTLTIFNPPMLPTTVTLTGAPTRGEPGSTSYFFKLSDYFPPGPNPLPQGTFSETELTTNLVLFAGGFQVDPILIDQTIEFDVTGEFWQHHYTLTLHPKSFIVFSSDSVRATGFVKHLVAPHSGEVEGEQIPLDAIATGFSAVTPPPDIAPFLSGTRLLMELARRNIAIDPRARLGFDAEVQVHPDGPDEDLALMVIGGRAPGSNAETFDSYIVGVAANHPGAASVPELPVGVLLGSGLALFAFVFRLADRRVKACATASMVRSENRYNV